MPSPVPGRAGNWLAVGGEAPGLNQSGIEGRCPLPALIEFWILSRLVLGNCEAMGGPPVLGRVPLPGFGKFRKSLTWPDEGRCPVGGRWPVPTLGRVPVLGVDGRVLAPVPGRVAGSCPADGRVGVAGRLVAGRCPMEGPLGAEGRLPAGRLMDGERLREGLAPPPTRPPPPRWATASPLTNTNISIEPNRIRETLFMGTPPSGLIALRHLRTSAGPR